MQRSFFWGCGGRGCSHPCEELGTLWIQGGDEAKKARTSLPGQKWWKEERQGRNALKGQRVEREREWRMGGSLQIRDKLHPILNQYRA